MKVTSFLVRWMKKRSTRQYVVPNTQCFFISRPHWPTFHWQHFKRLIYNLAVMGHTQYLPGKGKLAWFHYEWDFLLCLHWFMGGDSAELRGTAFMWTKHVWGFNDNLSRVDLFVVYRHTAGRNFISVLRGQWEGVNTINCCSVLKLELQHHKHAVRPEPDVLYTSVPL